MSILFHANARPLARIQSSVNSGFCNYNPETLSAFHLALEMFGISLLTVPCPHGIL
jgi:hypothetical protein